MSSSSFHPDLKPKELEPELGERKGTSEQIQVPTEIEREKNRMRKNRPYQLQVPRARNLISAMAEEEL